MTRSDGPGCRPALIRRHSTTPRRALVLLAALPALFVPVLATPAAGSTARTPGAQGDDPSGSSASTDGRGNGYVFVDHAQTDVYDAPRVVTHETGHVLGLPDTYSGPCSRLMSGGGPGPSCTNSYPDATERANVNAVWASLVARADLALAR